MPVLPEKFSDTSCKKELGSPQAKESSSEAKLMIQEAYG